jgi:hypothetical protein
MKPSPWSSRAPHSHGDAEPASGVELHEVWMTGEREVWTFGFVQGQQALVEGERVAIALQWP